MQVLYSILIKGKRVPQTINKSINKALSTLSDTAALDMHFPFNKLPRRLPFLLAFINGISSFGWVVY